MTDRVIGVVVSFIVSALLLLTVVAGVNFWEYRVRQDEGKKVRARLDAAWGELLRQAESEASVERLTQRNKHVEDLARVDAARRRELGRLQQRATRAEQALEANRAGAVAQTCTGAALAREDAEFLTRYAAEAAEQRLALVEAHAAYETCRQTLRSVTQGTQHGESSSTPRVSGP